MQRPKCFARKYAQREVPRRPAGIRYVAAVAGDLHTVLLRDDGEAVAFGLNRLGRCEVPPRTAGWLRAGAVAFRVRVSGYFRHFFGCFRMVSVVLWAIS